MSNPQTLMWYFHETTNAWRRERPEELKPMNLIAMAKLVREGRTVTFTARGHSMYPRIRDLQMVTVAPLKDEPKVDDIVLAKVKGRYYLHLITAERDGRFQISNMKGRVNGWASEIVGIWIGPT